MPTEQELQQQIDDLKKRLLLFEAHDHFITGGAPISLKNLPFYGFHQAVINLTNLEPQTALNYGIFFIADFDLEIIAAQASYKAAAGSVAAVDIYKLTTGQAKASGVTVLTGTFDLNTTVETPIRKTATTTRANRILKQGDRLALIESGTLTSLNNLTVIVYYLPL